MLHTIVRVLVNTAVTSLATSAALALFSKRELKRPAAAMNAVSHIFWGDKAFKRNEADWQHTFIGAALNSSAMMSWSAVGELLPRPRSLWGAARNGILVSAAAYVTDFYLVPKRMTPGFEERLSQRALWSIYATLAGAYALSAALSRPRPLAA